MARCRIIFVTGESGTTLTTIPGEQYLGEDLEKVCERSQKERAE